MTQPNTSSDQQPKVERSFGSGLLLVFIFLTTLLCGVVFFMFFWAPFKFRYQIARFWCQLFVWATRFFCQLTYEIEGLDHIQASQPAVILSNHQSAWETISLRVILPIHVTVLKKELVKIPLWGWTLTGLKSIIIDRSNQRAALKAIINKGTDCLNQGLFVLIFPEGTRANAQEVKPFNLGGAVLAEKSGYPVIPLAHNSGTFWSPRGFRIKSGIVKVKIGAPIPTNGRKANEINTQAEEWVKQAMIHLDA
jgi:1-acyl-sn-glycerol-3-phosphate acyltransferase